MQFTLVVFLLSLNALVFFEFHEFYPFNNLVGQQKSLLGVPKILKNVSFELKKNLETTRIQQMEMEITNFMAVDDESIYLKDKLIDDTISYGKWINHKIIDWTGGYTEPFIHPIDKEDEHLKFD